MDNAIRLAAAPGQVQVCLRWLQRLHRTRPEEAGNHRATPPLLTEALGLSPSGLPRQTGPGYDRRQAPAGDHPRLSAPKRKPAAQDRAAGA